MYDINVPFFYLERLYNAYKLDQLDMDTLRIVGATTGSVIESTTGSMTGSTTGWNGASTGSVIG